MLPLRVFLMEADVSVEPWYSSTVYLLVGFLALGVLVVGVILAVLWWTRLPKDK